ncbi:bacillithiol biosynthesis protein BshC, partial [Bacillus velezensis]|uniref:bacillithiol biosynthesis protein BshC n=1 Tax=Bacillus velezensis TaxID=492670 RepID=UPI0020BE9C5A
MKNHVLEDYWSPNTAIHQFFEYEYNDQAFEERAKQLAQHARAQKELTAIIRQFMEPLGLANKANEHLEQLEQGPMVVVGG